MNFPQNSSDLDYKFNSKLTSSQNSHNTKDIFINIPSSQITINFSKDSSVLEQKESRNIKKKPKTYISTYENKEKDEELEEEINSDEYVSSTNLDVETNTYINLTNNIKGIEETSQNTNLKDKNNNIELNKGNFSQGKLKIKDNNNLNMLLINNIQEITNEKETIINNTPKMNKANINNINNNNKKKIHHQNNKSDYFINIRPDSTNLGREKKYYSKNSSIDKLRIFTPSNENKMKFKALREMIIKKLEQYQNKNPFYINQSNTINIIENNDTIKNKNKTKLKSINNDIMEKNIKIELDSNQNKRNKTSRITHNNSISIISNNMNKNMPNKNFNQQNIQGNNNININIYNKNIIKNLGTINIDEQKYHFIPQNKEKVKTQGRIGKIVYSNQDKRNNFIYISNYSKNINNNHKSSNTPNQNKKNRISPPPNLINNVEYYNSICANKSKKLEEHNYLKHKNIHSLKNLKSENNQKNIKKYLLEDDYLTIFPLNKEKNIENQKLKMYKDSKNKKNNKNINNKYDADIKTNQDNMKIKKIIPSQNKQLRSVNSCYGRKVNPNILNNYQSEQILKTISNNNKKIDIYNNSKLNYNVISDNKKLNSSNKRMIDETAKKNKELSFNSVQNKITIKNLLSLKKIKNLKNKFVLQSLDYNCDNNSRDTNSYHIKKTKPITKRIRLDLVTENYKNNLKKNKKYISNIDNDDIGTKSNNNSSAKRIIYIDNNNFKNISSRPLIYNSLSPNSQSIKQLMNKSKITNIKEMCNNINFNNNQGRNTYNIYSSSRFNNNSNILGNKSNNNYNFNNKNIFRKIQKENLKHNHHQYNNIIKAINYNSENLHEYQSSNLSNQHKKTILFNNISNYNINSSNNTLNNISNIREIPINNSMCKKTIEILSPFSLINKNHNKNGHKKFYINKENTQQYNHNKNSKERKNGQGLIDQNIIYLDNNKIKNIRTFTGANSSNKYLYNKNNIYTSNKNENFIHSNHHNINSSQYNYNARINNSQNNNFFHFSNSNDKDRNSIINKSSGNLYLNKNKKEKNSKEKNIVLDLYEKNQKSNRKHMSPIQELKNDIN